MGIYSDYFRATAAELLELELNAGVISPYLDTPELSQEDGVYFVYRDGCLWSFEGRPAMAHDTSLLADVLPGVVISSDVAIHEPLPTSAEKEHWTWRYHSNLTRALSDLPEADVPSVAARWRAAAKEKGNHNDSEAMKFVLGKLVVLARLAIKNGQDLFCWESL